MSGEQQSVHLNASTSSSARSTRAQRFVWPAITRAELVNLATIALQVALVVFLLIAFRIENAAFFYRVAPIAAVGFVVHHLLPMPYRLRFFAGLSLVTIVVVFGFKEAGWLIALGLLLIAIAHLPIRFAWRVAILLGVGAVFVTMRLGKGPQPWSAVIWPVLASMFMFRLIAYMYDLRHQKEKPVFARTLAYFFGLPNVSFLLYPVIDFATFKRTYYDRDAFQIYREGVSWMVRGVLHLMLYRLIHQYGTMLPTDVHSGTDLIRYMLANFGLYLRVSGQFHLIVGMLHLFGFRLPETHHFFYVASSFTDFWRRINIYWKDFMTKVIYMPAYFRLKKRGDAFALVTSTLLVFFATWFFHSYQWFWLLGTWLMSWTDTLFWAILAVLLVFNVLREYRHGRTRTTKSSEWSSAEQGRMVLNTTLTFSVICLLWTLWTMPTVREFGALMTAPTWRVQDLMLLLAVLAAVAVMAWLAQRRDYIAAKGKTASITRGPLPSLAVLGLAWLLGEPYVRQFYSANVNSFWVATRVEELSAAERREMERGYYERIVDVNRFNGALWDVYTRRPKEWRRLADTDLQQQFDDPRLFGLKPNHRADVNGALVTTNRWGMRDKDYPQSKGVDVTRIAVLGASYVMGIGVNDGAFFESVLEDRLAADTNGHGTRKVEVLNFAVNAYLLQHQLALMESGALQNMNTDVVLLVGHMNDLDRGPAYLYRLLKRGQQTPYDTLRALMRAAQWNAPKDESDARRIMDPYTDEISRVTFQRMGQVCHENGWRCVYAYIPMPFDRLAAESRSTLLAYASAGGLETIDLGDVYARHNERDLIVADWDFHPNVRGHQVIAQRLQNELLTKSGLLLHNATPVTMPSRISDARSSQR